MLSAVAALGLSLAPSPAQAGHEAWVSNLDTDDGPTDTYEDLNRTLATSFKTGPGGPHAVTSVVLDVRRCTTAQLDALVPAAKIYDNAPVGGYDVPGTEIGALSKQSAITRDSAGLRVTYTPGSPIQLSGETTYFLLIPEHTGGENCGLRTVNNNTNETGTPGWEIGDRYLWRLTDWVNGPNNIILRFSINEPHLPGRLRQKFDWCFNRMSEDACAAAIARWEYEDPSEDLPAGDHCPANLRIRTATTSGVKCDQSYDPLPAGGALAEAWGVTEIAPPAETTDDWDGTERPCHQQGHGYYVLPTNRHHGLGKGCHYHNGIRQDRGNVQWSGHHEHKFVNRH